MTGMVVDRDPSMAGVTGHGEDEQPPSVVFLPGAGGSPDFWGPVAELLPSDWRKTLLSWPGAGDQIHDPPVRSFEDLIELIQCAITGQCDLIAHSMGGVAAVGFALRHPQKVRRLVLVATSGGVNVAALGGSDWRADYVAEFPSAAAWITEQHVDYTQQLRRVTAPTLLLWGDRDPISPIAVGRRLADLLPDSQLVIVPGGTHALAREQPAPVAREIVRHLSAGPDGGAGGGEAGGVRGGITPAAVDSAVSEQGSSETT